MRRPTAPGRVTVTRYPLGVRPTLVFLAILAVVAGGCDLLVREASFPLEVSNGTNLVMTVRINGMMVAMVPPEDSVRLEPGGLPGLPWDVEAQTSIGRLLARMHVAEGDVENTATSNRGVVELRDLPCGRLVMWVGAPPSLPAPPPDPLVPCDP